MKEGSIIFLTLRKKKPLRRIILSKGISILTRKKNQSLEKVKVHSAILYSSNGHFMVRDMDRKGNETWFLEDYKKKYEDRIEIRKNPFFVSGSSLENFNGYCRNKKVKYDYFNTFFFQIFRSLFGFQKFPNSKKRRMCAEDVQRCFNILIPRFFETPEQSHPNELYEITKNWKLMYKG